MRGLQNRIDMERLRARTAMKACLRISSMMWDSFLECQMMLNIFVYRNPSDAIKLLQPAHRAKIIPFQPKTKQCKNL